ncbi:glycosyltransferase family 4 protein [Modestobacter sp. VKM Ac-2985]|uniref:glycosyltransferase family 4 protein n=1 Tax=Modestobacter sp. VKM Ac-2985 TaxID=3004139 RepID=UPI0022AB955A|nr:glycosyltransferase family 1 protein [Modestobacter sp. VKM Ac-2985]MCZ2838592.1 glycosyltransferase family 1 protein [Modestobacter sp. VKM Ac-2985]
MTSTLPQAGSAATDVARALVQRLGAAAQQLLDQVPPPAPDPEQEAAQLLWHLVETVRASGDTQHLWLLLTALSSAFPTGDELVDARRRLQLDDTGDAVAWLLEAAHSAVLNAGTPSAEMDVVVGAVVADVDFCATNEHHTGIQRVVRETVPRWDRDHDLLLVAWTRSNGALRQLDAHERDLVLRWGQTRTTVSDPELGTEAGTTPPRLLVPWRSTVILPENPEPARCPAIAALAEHSGNTVTAIGYDCIPIVSPELIHPGLPDRFVHYLSVVKHARVVAGISASATEEFRGFSRMMPSQGLPGPEVVEVALPVEVPVPTGSPASPHERPVVISVGSFEPRKNQLAVLHAAERLWREGLRFELKFIGGGGWRTEFDASMNQLAASGRPVSVAVRISDEELWGLYRRARFTVFASLHEGYGLPVAESLAYGTPALTTDYGSTAEIAAEGGALTVDPRDDDALADAMRRLLTDDALITELQQGARSRPVRTWDDYARELWDALARPLPRGEQPR